MNDNRPLVSIVTPCYNVEKKIVCYFESILAQTYNNLELILVNDGSADNTEDVIERYVPKLKKKGITVKYIYQSNGGAASAVRTGLDYVTGKYLMWPDADDILMEDSVEQKVVFLENHPEYAFVRTNAYVINSEDIDDRSKLIVKHKNIKRHRIYNECIRFRTFYCPGCYMVRWSSFLNSNPDKYIYKTKFGQNIQMLLPMAYNYECGYIDKPLYGYILYNDSHSRLGGNRTYEKKKEYSYNIEKIMLKTMEHTGVKRDADFRNVRNDFCIRRLRLAYNENMYEDKSEEYKKIKGIRKLDPAALLMRLCKQNRVVDIIDRFEEMLKIAIFQLTNRR